MAKVIEAVQIFKKVEDVTAAKDDPPPGEWIPRKLHRHS